MLKERKSNFELLRIIAILLIIAFHYCNHGNNETIFSGQLSINQVVSVVLGSWGIVGVYLFVFISAYFLIDSKKYKIEKIVLIALSTSFYALLFLGLTYVTKSAHFSIKSVAKCIISPLTDQYWFVQSYMILFLFYPFLNRFMELVSKKTLYYLVLLATLTIPFYRTIIYSAPVAEFCLFIYLYLLMGYLKKTPNNFFERNAKKGFGITFSLTVIGYTLCLIIENHTHTAFYNIIHERVFRNFFSPITLLLALFLFYIFKNLRISSSKLINTIAASTLGIYLIHENPSLRDYLWDKWLHINQVFYKPTYVIYMLLSIALIFAVCCIIDIARKYLLEKPIIIPLLKKVKGFSKINKIYEETVMCKAEDESLESCK